jgi:hypothetical protein
MRGIMWLLWPPKFVKIDALARTSETLLKANFGEFLFYALG